MNEDPQMVAFLAAIVFGTSNDAAEAVRHARAIIAEAEKTSPVKDDKAA